MHTAKIWAQGVDAAGRYLVTGSDDRTVRVWSIADGKLLRTIWVPVGPSSVGAIYAVAISPDGSTIAAGGFTERTTGGTVIYVFDRGSGALVRRITGLDRPALELFMRMYRPTYDFIKNCENEYEFYKYIKDCSTYFMRTYKIDTPPSPP